MNLARYRKLAAAVLAGLVVVAASIPTDADPRLIAAGQVVTALAVLCAPANAPKPNQQAADRLFGPRPPADP